MKPGQKLTRWWSEYVGGVLRTPQQIYRAALAELSEQDGQSNTDRFFNGLPPDDGIKFDIPSRLAHPSHFMRQIWLDQFARADWQHCDPRLMRWSAMVVTYAKKRNIPLYVHCAFRGADEQNALAAKGVSKARAGKSAHNIGEAVDIVHGVYHWDMTQQEWLFIHNLGALALQRLNASLPKARQLQLTWGGTFKSIYDPAHWEITDFRDRRRSLPEGPPLLKSPAAIMRDIRF